MSVATIEHIGDLRLLVNGKSHGSPVVSVTLAANGLPIATASIDHFGSHWWVTRVLVQLPWRRQGLGSTVLLRALQETAKDIGDGAAAHGAAAQEVWVVPGGYDMDEAQQRAFYLKHGFEPQFRDGGEVLVWSPSKR